MVALADRLRAEPIVAVYASPAYRTLRTARLLVRDRPLSVRQRRNLLDLDYGAFAGLRGPDASRRDPVLWRRWLQAPHTIQFPGGESLADLRRRIERFLAEVTSRHSEGSVLVATHESPLSTMVCIVRGLDDSFHNKFPFHTASVTVMELTERGSSVLTLNDTGHLRGTDATG